MSAFWHYSGCLTGTYVCLGCEEERCPDCAPSPGEKNDICADCYNAEDGDDAA